MATRPVFFIDKNNLKVHEDIEFHWFSGLATCQKQKSIKSLHDNFLNRHTDKNILEISSKSTQKIGILLSAFNLKYHSDYYNYDIFVECAFQGSKVFENGGPYNDLYFKNSKDAKKDDRIKNSGKIVGFRFEKNEWKTEPKTMFYDWLYIKAICQNNKLLNELLKYDAFTDIEFNPDKSINCQAKSAALLVSLFRRGILNDANKTIDSFNIIYQKSINGNKHYLQGTFFDNKTDA